ncbi:MAG TPA: VWA domain-containing protein [Acidimicrobiia bacterium]
MTSGPINDLAGFASALRNRGLTVTPDQTSDMASALLLVDPAKRTQVRAAMQCLTVNDPGERTPFAEEFDLFFEGLAMPKISEQHSSNSTAKSAAKPLLQPVGIERKGDTNDRAGSSAMERLGARDFSTLNDEDLITARKMVANMVWQPTEFRTRRWGPANHGARPDLRKTLREMAGPTGELMRLELRERRKKQRPLIVIADISGSMEKYADLFLVFAHAASRRLRHVETFTFSTELTRITVEMSRRDARSALALVTESVRDWSGGTQIGEAFARWNRLWSRRMARGGPVVLVLSDGWDCGDPDLLRREMARLARSVHRVIWLNPLAARESYEPVTKGMQAVLPYVDHLLPAASVNDLRGVVQLLESINGRTRM